jgi:hypothetical protein
MFERYVLPHHQDHIPDNGGSTHLWNVGLLLWDYTLLYPRRLSSFLPSTADMFLKCWNCSLYLACRISFGRLWENVLNLVLLFEGHRMVLGGKHLYFA